MRSKTTSCFNKLGLHRASSQNMRTRFFSKKTSFLSSAVSGEILESHILYTHHRIFCVKNPLKTNPFLLQLRISPLHVLWRKYEDAVLVFIEPDWIYFDKFPEGLEFSPTGLCVGGLLQPMLSKTSFFAIHWFSQWVLLLLYFISFKPKIQKKNTCRMSLHSNIR